MREEHLDDTTDQSNRDSPLPHQSGEVEVRRECTLRFTQKRKRLEASNLSLERGGGWKRRAAKRRATPPSYLRGGGWKLPTTPSKGEAVGREK